MKASLFVLLVVSIAELGCAPVRTITVRTRPERPAVQRSPVVLDPGAFLDALGGLLLDQPLALRVQPISWSPRAPNGASLLDVGARRELALSYALDAVWLGIGDALRGVVTPEVFRSIVLSALGGFMLLVVAPEPITKLVAIALAAYLIAYLGCGPVSAIVEAFRTLESEVDRAESYAALESAGRRFGRVLGDNGARVLVLATIAALGAKTGGQSIAPGLPGYAQAALAAEAEAGFQLAAATGGGVSAITFGVENITLALAPTAMASAAWQPAAAADGLRGRTPEGRIHIGERGLKHASDRHLAGGAQNVDASTFNPGEDLRALVHSAESRPSAAQSNGRFATIVEAQRTIGIDRTTGAPTSVYTVITTVRGELVTLFPGKP